MDTFVELEDGTRITVYQYDDLMDHKPVTLPDGRVIQLSRTMEANNGRHSDG